MLWTSTGSSTPQPLALAASRGYVAIPEQPPCSTFLCCGIDRYIDIKPSISQPACLHRQYCRAVCWQREVPDPCHKLRLYNLHAGAGLCEEKAMGAHSGAR